MIELLLNMPTRKQLARLFHIYNLHGLTSRFPPNISKKVSKSSKQENRRFEPCFLKVSFIDHIKKSRLNRKIEPRFLETLEFQRFQRIGMRIHQSRGEKQRFFNIIGGMDPELQS